MRYFIAIVLWISLGISSPAQPSERKNTPDYYVEKYKDDAIREMQMSRVPASITLAQGMLESDNGNSALAVYANNHFGIKCHSEWTGDTYTQDDDERNECFRKYPSAYDSYADHSKFLSSRQRYAELFKLQTTDYKGWARGLKAAGYATDPRYAERLIDIIERYNLNLLDRQEPLPSIVAQPKNNSHRHQTTAAIAGRTIMYNNDVKYIVVKRGDTFYRISQELDLELWQLYKYNDLSSNAVLKAGQILYIQPKRKRSRGEKLYTVKTGDETLYTISQQYGIRMSSLCKYNKLLPNAQLKSGQVVHLRRP